jgi:mRNA-degrading endonuclease RelE of RelBE toxin-antitoxin system
MEKTYKVLLTDIALKNLEPLPSKQITKILDKIELLESFPEMGTSIQKQKWQGYRQLIVDWYRVVYKTNDEKTYHNTFNSAWEDGFRIKFLGEKKSIQNSTRIPSTFINLQENFPLSSSKSSAP